jgi:uncharacterized hydrophobic protein (TIGR00271 family)
VIEVKLFGEADLMTSAARRLDRLDGVRHVVLTPAARTGRAVIRADARHNAVDEMLAQLKDLGIPPEDVVLIRVEEIGLGVTQDSDQGLVWADIVGLAGSNARLVWRYLTLMVVAGVIACYGVLDYGAILVVGAMAVSPDLLPITAAGVAVVSRDGRLLVRALLTLAAGMTAAGLAATASTALQDALGVLPEGFQIDNTILKGLDTVGWETVTVAFFAGIAGMLALETRASSGVGVAISVTTIPAAAYLGIAAAMGEVPEALGGLGVLVTNVAMLIVGASLTLAAQRALRRRRGSALSAVR